MWPTDDEDAASVAVRPTSASLPRALRRSAIDLYYNSMRLVGLNLVWGLGVAVVYLVSLAAPLAALGLALLLALPTVGMFRVAALIVRHEPAALSDGLAAWRSYLLPALAGGLALLSISLVLFIDMAAAVGRGDVVGIAFATMAGWGLVVAAMLACCWWPLLVDPAHPGRSGRAALRLAGYLLIAHPLRMAALTMVMAAILLLSTVLMAAIVTVSFAFCALFACHYVLPAADRLEAQLSTKPVPEAARS